MVGGNLSLRSCLKYLLTSLSSSLSSAATSTQQVSQTISIFITNATFRSPSVSSSSSAQTLVGFNYHHSHHLCRHGDHRRDLQHQHRLNVQHSDPHVWLHHLQNLSAARFAQNTFISQNNGSIYNCNLLQISAEANRPTHIHAGSDAAGLSAAPCLHQDQIKKEWER